VPIYDPWAGQQPQPGDVPIYDPYAQPLQEVPPRPIDPAEQILQEVLGIIEGN
jgi:hypothetical protein